MGYRKFRPEFKRRVVEEWVSGGKRIAGGVRGETACQAEDEERPGPSTVGGADPEPRGPGSDMIPDADPAAEPKPLPESALGARPEAPLTEVASRLHHYRTSPETPPNHTRTLVPKMGFSATCPRSQERQILEPGDAV
jgi:hypothetical protein